MPNPVVVDTNVPITADGRSAYSAKCAKACIERLEHVIRSGIVVLDSLNLIIKEYRNNLVPSQPPTPGNRFLKWVFINWHNPERCVVTPITRDANDSFVEFPSNEGLRGFDRSDRKFVAVSMSHAARPTILQAADSKWWGFKAAFESAGVNVEFLCPGEIEAKFQEKMGQ